MGLEGGADGGEGGELGRGEGGGDEFIREEGGWGGIIVVNVVIVVIVVGIVGGRGSRREGGGGKGGGVEAVDGDGDDGEDAFGDHGGEDGGGNFGTGEEGGFLYEAVGGGEGEVGEEEALLLGSAGEGGKNLTPPIPHKADVGDGLGAVAVGDGFGYLDDALVEEAGDEGGVFGEVEAGDDVGETEAFFGGEEGDNNLTPPAPLLLEGGGGRGCYGCYGCWGCWGCWGWGRGRPGRNGLGTGRNHGGLRFVVRASGIGGVEVGGREGDEGFGFGAEADGEGGLVDVAEGAEVVIRDPLPEAELGVADYGGVVEEGEEGFGTGGGSGLIVRTSGINGLGTGRNHVRLRFVGRTSGIFGGEGGDEGGVEFLWAELDEDTHAYGYFGLHLGRDGVGVGSVKGEREDYLGEHSSCYCCYCCCCCCCCC